MIGRLRGIIVYKKPPELMLDVGGVGYELLASVITFGDLPDVDQETTLFTHFVVREDSQTLYAFSTDSERSLYRTLLKVNGVGPKMALAIVSGMTVNEFVERIDASDIAGLTKLPGVGKKTAERLIIEMRDRLSEVIYSASSEGATSGTVVQQSNYKEEAVTALLALGYKPAQASKMVSAVANETLNVEQIIRAALKASLK